MEAGATARSGASRSSSQPCTWMDTLRLAASIRNTPSGWAPHHSTLPLPLQSHGLATSLRDASPCPDGSPPPAKRHRICASPEAEPVNLWSRENSPSSFQFQGQQHRAQLRHAMDSFPDFCEASPLPSRHSLCSAEASPAAYAHSQPVPRHLGASHIDIANFLAQPVDDLLRCGSQESLSLGFAQAHRQQPHPASQRNQWPSTHTQMQAQGEWLAKGMSTAAEEPTPQQSDLEALLCALGAPSRSLCNSKPCSKAWSMGISGDSLEAVGAGAKRAEAIPEDQQLQLRQIQNLIWDVLYGDSEEQEQARVAANSPAPSSCSATGCAKNRGRHEEEMEGEEEVSCSGDSERIDLNLYPGQ